jgi:hypothetical protein
MRWGPAIVTVAAIGFVAVGTLADAVLPAPPVTPVLEHLVTPDEGAWHCAVGATEPGATLHVAASTPVEGEGRVRLDRYGSSADGGLTLLVPAGGVAVHTVPEDAGPVGVVSVWRDAPAVVARTWERDVRGETPGIVHGPCQPAPSRTWYLPGVTTVGGATAHLEVANPFDTDAAISVTLLTPNGEERPELLRNIGVPARTVMTIDLNDHAPERTDLGAVVDVRAGRVVVEGWLSVDAGVGGVGGMTLVQLATAPSDSWVVPGFSVAARDTWVWVANPDERPAALALTVHTPTGAGAAGLAGEVTVNPFSVRRIALAEILPEDVHEGALTITSENEVPIVVSTGTQVAAEPAEQAEEGEEGEEIEEAAGVERTGFAVMLGIPGPDPAWAVPGLALPGREGRLHVVNPTDEEARVTVRLLTQDGPVAVRALRDVTVQPGATWVVDLEEIAADVELHTLMVEASVGSVVVSADSAAREGRLNPVLHAGVPSAIWTARPAAQVARDPGLVRRIGTSHGPATRPVDAEPDPSDLGPGD